MNIIHKIFLIIWKIIRFILKLLVVLLIWAVGFVFVMKEFNGINLCIFGLSLILGTIVATYFIMNTDNINKCNYDIKKVKREVDLDEIKQDLENFRISFFERKNKYIYMRLIYILVIIINFVISIKSGGNLLLILVNLIIEGFALKMLIDNIYKYDYVAKKDRNIFLKNTVNKINSNLTINANLNKELLYLYMKNADFGKPFNYKIDDCIAGKIKRNVDLKISNMILFEKNLGVQDEVIFATLETDRFISGEVKIEQKNTKNIYEKNEEKSKEDEFTNLKDIELDNQYFEKYFNIESSNDILAMQALTHDVMKEILIFLKKYRIPFEMKIKDNYIFFKFHITIKFKPCIYNVNSEIQQLIDEFNILKIIITFLEKINIR